MGQFFKFIFASCLGVILASIVLTVFSFMVMMGVAASADEPKPIHSNSVLSLKFDDQIPERTNNLQMESFDLKPEKILGLADIVKTIETAKDDDDIKGIYIECDGISAGFATMDVLRDAIVDFKTSGKFVIAYSRYYTQGAYYLASVADKVYINPMGGIDFRGFAAQIPFFKEMLDNIGVEMQVFYAGDFKSATEPFRRTEMSEQNRLQVREYLNSIYNTFVSDLSESRGISVPKLKEIADTYAARDAEAAVALGMADVAGYEDEALEDMRGRLGLDEDDKFRTISLENYNQSRSPKRDYSGSRKIAVVYAEGTVVDGKGENGTIGDAKYVKIIRKLRKNDKVDAIVLRINSGGGSAMSSENIWRELSLAKEAGKKIVVSMGDYAASGGYYIACMADEIYAQPNTLTGSIGVFSMIPNAGELLNDKMGVRFDTVRTGTFSTGITPFGPMSEQERQLAQASTDKIYETFLKRVADGRDMTRDEVHQVAQGRVWTGDKAAQIGLVDKIGDLEDAIQSAASLAGIEKYRIAEYPKVKDQWQQLLEDVMGMEETMTNTMLKNEMGEYYPYYEQLKSVKEAKGVQARLPFIIDMQ